MKFFEKILIANRGEIAIRVMRACRELDIDTVAIYSAVDKNALHVKYADEAFPVGEAHPSKSYLNMDRIVDIAKMSGAEAIHPGYGFLAENYRFAKLCADEGVIFIGPEVKDHPGHGLQDREQADDEKGRCAGASRGPMTVSAISIRQKRWQQRSATR